MSGNLCYLPGNAYVIRTPQLAASLMIISNIPSKSAYGAMQNAIMYSIIRDDGNFQLINIVLYGTKFYELLSENWQEVSK